MRYLADATRRAVRRETDFTFLGKRATPSSHLTLFCRGMPVICTVHPGTCNGDHSCREHSIRCCVSKGTAEKLAEITNFDVIGS